MDKLALRARFEKEYPGVFFLDADETVALKLYLRRHGWLDQESTIVNAEKPGAGNMNYVLRIQPSGGADSFIIKQSRPWVEKYPQIDAPFERIRVEQQYYHEVSKSPILRTYSPIIIGYDEASNILLMEDLGASIDFTSVYKVGQYMDETCIQNSITYLNELHQIGVSETFPLNMEMRQLNHQHIFHLPFLADNGFDLDQIQMGLQEVAKPFQTDTQLRNEVGKLGTIYLAKGDTLLHGDFYPGSLLLVQKEIKVIDPEFSFVGPLEWDIAVFIAHLFLAQSPISSIKKAFAQFNRKTNFDSLRFKGFVGTEIMRRLIGLAQLPLEMDLPTKEKLLNQAKSWIIAGDLVDF